MISDTLPTPEIYRKQEKPIQEFHWQFQRVIIRQLVERTQSPKNLSIGAFYFLNLKVLGQVQLRHQASLHHIEQLLQLKRRRSRAHLLRHPVVFDSESQTAFNLTTSIPSSGADGERGIAARPREGFDLNLQALLPFKLICLLD